MINALFSTECGLDPKTVSAIAQFINDPKEESIDTSDYKNSVHGTLGFTHAEVEQFVEPLKESLETDVRKVLSDRTQKNLDLVILSRIQNFNDKLSKKQLSMYTSIVELNLMKAAAHIRELEEGNDGKTIIMMNGGDRPEGGIGGIIAKMIAEAISKRKEESNDKEGDKKEE